MAGAAQAVSSWQVGAQGSTVPFAPCLLHKPGCAWCLTWTCMACYPPVYSLMLVWGCVGWAQKDETDAKKARQAEVDEAQKKIAEIMVEAQAQVGARLAS